MAYDVSKRPGAWVSARTRVRDRRIALAVAGVCMLAVLAIWISLNQNAVLLVVISVAAVAAMARITDRHIQRAARLRRGAQSEVAVGDELAGLVTAGFTVLHDIPQVGEGNIDHVVSGPTGVYLIETKHRRYEDDQLRKAKRQAVKLHGKLGVWVTAVVCLDRRRGRPYRRDGVWIVCREDVSDWLKSQRNAVLPFERLAAFADSLPSS